MTSRIAVATCLGDPQGGSLRIRHITSYRSSWSREVHLRMTNSDSFSTPFLSSTQAAACTTVDDWPKDVSCAGVSWGLIVFPCLQGQSSLNLSGCPVGPVSCNVSHTGKVFPYLFGQTRACKHVKFPSSQLTLNAGWCAPLARSPIDK